MDPYDLQGPESRKSHTHNSLGSQCLPFTYLGWVGFGWVRLVWVRLGWVGSVQLGLGRITGWVGSCQVGPDRVGSGHAKAGQAGAKTEGKVNAKSGVSRNTPKISRRASRSDFT